MRETDAHRERDRINAAWRAAGVDPPTDRDRVAMGKGALGPIEMAHWSGLGPVLRVWVSAGVPRTPEHQIRVFGTVNEALQWLGVK